jgi:toxin ParE1/3/4
MSFPLIIRPEAEQDLAEGRDWYEGQRAGLGGDFLRHAEDVFERLRDTPTLYAEVYRGVRRCKLKRFPYVVYYRLRGDQVEVLGVIHASRHPRVWQSRA